MKWCDSNVTTIQYISNITCIGPMSTIEGDKPPVIYNLKLFPYLDSSLSSLLISAYYQYVSHISHIYHMCKIYAANLCWLIFMYIYQIDRSKYCHIHFLVVYIYMYHNVKNHHTYNWNIYIYIFRGTKKHHIHTDTQTHTVQTENREHPHTQTDRQTDR